MVVNPYIIVCNNWHLPYTPSTTIYIPRLIHYHSVLGWHLSPWPPNCALIHTTSLNTHQLYCHNCYRTVNPPPTPFSMTITINLPQQYQNQKCDFFYHSSPIASIISANLALLRYYQLIQSFTSIITSPIKARFEPQFFSLPASSSLPLQPFLTHILPLNQPPLLT